VRDASFDQEDVVRTREEAGELVGGDQASDAASENHDSFRG
jgi:hypothetical protein